MSDLLSGRYPQAAALNSILGIPSQAAQGNLPIRTNLEYTGINGLVDTTTSLATGVMTAVMIPVDVGMTVTKVSCLVGATGASTPTHSFGAIYSGTNVAAPPLIAQSTDGLTTAIAAATATTGRLDFTLTTATTITAAMAPYGYIWAALMVTASTVPSLVTQAVGAAACQYQWFTNTGAAGTATAFGITSGSGITTTAPATLIYASQKLVVPVSFLS